jgi:hypothetical protein
LRERLSRAFVERFRLALQYVAGIDIGSFEIGNSGTASRQDPVMELMAFWGDVRETVPDSCADVNKREHVEMAALTP